MKRYRKPEIDERMSVQGAAFTLHGTSLALETLKEADQFLRKFIYPRRRSTQDAVAVARPRCPETSAFP